MATITAKATGNWSAGSTWDSDPALPAAGDTVDCAGYTVTVDQDVAVVQLKSTGAGYFAVTAARNITANILSDTGHSGGGVVRCSHGSGTVSITGNVQAGPVYGVIHTSTGALDIIGNVTGGSATSSYGLTSTNLATVAITGNVTGGAGSASRGVNNNAAGTMTVTGSATGGAGPAAHGAFNNSTGILRVYGTAYGGGQNGSCGLYGANASGITSFRKASLSGTAGNALGGFCKIEVDATNFVVAARSDTGVDYYLSNDYPTEAQVESGVTYKLGTQTGTFAGGRPAFGDRTGGKW